MAAVKSGTRGKPAKLQKKGTATTKSHRFEPFSQRIAKLKIDPVHRVRRTDFGDENGDDVASYFRASLEHWMEMNLSENFTAFAQRAANLCESLPQVLYHEDRIMELLMEYISKRDELSMEPLLSLLAQFARDLGSRFEKHFASAVTLVASVAATHSSIEVIEWSFTCLAWIFKFLSRLLVPDLRQLLGLMIPYLGKERQKHFVMRFAAESLSFLLRKAALVYYKNKEPLTRAVTFLFEDLDSVSETRQVASYQEGIMSMFADSIKGVKGGIHSNGTDIFSCLVEIAASRSDNTNTVSLQVLSGVLINMIHQTSADTFSPLLDIICSHVETSSAKPPDASASVDVRLLFLCVATRKGTRVQNWKRVHQALLSLLQKLSAVNDFKSESAQQLFAAVVIGIQISPMDELLPYMRPIMEAVSHERFAGYFLQFCSMFSESSYERFQSVVLQYLQRFIVSRWKGKEPALCLTLPRLHDSSCVNSEINRPGYIACPNSWKEHIVGKFKNNVDTLEKVALLHSYTKLHGAVSLSTQPSILPEVAQCLHHQVESAMRSGADVSAAHKLFAHGQAFLSYVRLAPQVTSLDPDLWELIVARGPKYSTVPVFLEATLEYIAGCANWSITSEDDVEPFATALLDNLSSASHQLRLLSLKILQALLKGTNIEDNGVIDVAIEVEESELSLQTARFLSMQVRKLGASYADATTKRWLDRFIPNFCFGLLTKKLTPLWQDVCETIKVICEVRVGEVIVADLAVRWLESANPSGPDGTSSEDEPESTFTSEFECFNATNAERAMAKSFHEIENAEELLLKDFNSVHAAVETIPTSARSQALRVLSSVPHVAEKRSRQLVPHFLTWASGDEDAPSKASDTYVSWNLRDRKAMLTLFGQFINPRVLFKSEDVHNALLELMCNGDGEIQKLALKAFFTWKLPHIQPYETNFLNMVDDARFRDELAVFVNVGQDNSVMEEEHRPLLLPVVLRVLYGRMVARAGSRSGQGGQEGRRKVILRTISQLSESDFGYFIRIAFGPLGDIKLLDEDAEGNYLSRELMGLRRQFGLLKTIETMFETLKTKMLPYAEESLNVALYCLVRAYRLIQEGSAAAENTNDKEESQSALVRSVRQIGTHCLDLVFSVSPNTDWSPYIPLIFSEIINPRLDAFAIETAQGVSHLLHLFGTWASSPKSALYLAGGNNSVIPRVVDCLDVESAQDQVKMFVMDNVVKSLAVLAAGDEDDQRSLIREKVLAPHVEYILIRMEALLRGEPGRYLTISAVETLSKLAPFVQSSPEITKFISTATYLLQQPADRVPPKAKGGLLEVMQHFLPLYDAEGNDGTNQELFEVLSSLFDYFKDNENRQSLSIVFSALSKHLPELKDVALLCEDLNSLSQNRLDEVDFDRRLAAFNTINEEKHSLLTARQWRPLIFNFLYNVKDEEELAIRSSASFGLKRFIECASSDANRASEEFSTLTEKVLLPALREGVKQNAETVRAEFVSTMGHLVKFNPTMPAVSDMYDLLANGDEEASFFNNVLHIQQHRRLRALRRLAAEKGKLQATNVSTFFFRLLEHFVFDQAEDEKEHNLAAEAVATIGALSESLQWNQFRAKFRMYKGYMQTRPGLEKKVIRLLGQFTDSLAQAMNRKDLGPETEGAMEGVEPTTKSTLSSSLPSTAQITSEIKSNFVPYLTEFVHMKDESQVSLRLPVAVTTVKLLKLLPEEDMAMLLPPVLLDLCGILKSKVQESRDIARKTLAEVALILGPSYFAYILKELRSTLTKGYQLHVLSFTVHSLLVVVTEQFETGALDDNLGTLAAIVMDDIFGTVGQEKDAEEYVSKMKEVKSSKSYDSMELLAKNGTIRRVSALIRPVQMLLREKLTSSLVKKVEELLRRLGIGLFQNPGAESRDLLVFCYEVIKEAYRTETTPANEGVQNESQARFIVKLVTSKKAAKGGSTSSYAYKLARFGLDVLRSVFNKYNSLMTLANVAGFLPVIGDALVQGYEEVKLSAIKLLSTIIKLPLAELDKNADVYLVEGIKLIKESPNTNSEASQAALKLIASILRERKSTKIKDSHLGYLLKRISTDIDEPDRQGVTFNFIRAVMSRKFVVPEMYELVDNIAAMMVTNHTRSARDLARGVFIHFMIEYPQAKSRWTKQLAFLAKNLDYEHKEGRQSVMEAIHLLLSKTSGDLAQDIVGTFFVPVVMVMSNDESVECREMAGVLLSDIFARADTEQAKSILTPLRTWVEQTENHLLTTTGLQAMRIFFEAEGGANKESEVRFVTELLPYLIDTALEHAESKGWDMLYYSLRLFMKLAQLFPTMTLTNACVGIWSKVYQSLLYPHVWVRSCAANLIGVWLADEAKANAAAGYASLPLVGSSGLKLSANVMLDIMRASMACLRSPNISEELAAQTIRNVVFLGRCFGQNDLELPTSKANGLTGEISEESDDEDANGSVQPTDKGKTAIQYIFERCAGILRREPISTRAEALIGKTACMKLLAALCKHLDTAQITPSLQTIILPLVHLTDPSIPAPRSLDEGFQTSYKALVSSSQEILDLLQKKLGTTEFVAHVSTARESVKTRREERRVKRRIEAVADPEKVGREKRRKNERKKDKRKEKSGGFQGRRRGW